MALTAKSSSSGPKVAKAAVGVLGGQPTVHQYLDRDEHHDVAVLTCRNVPHDGWLTCSTVTLHQFPNLLEDRDVRVELMMVGREADGASLEGLLSSAAFCVMKDQWLAAPGVVFPGFVAQFFESSTTPHLMWVEPFPARELSGLEIPDVGTIHWLLGVPLSDAECDHLDTEGFDALEARLEAADAEYFDLWRPSVI